MSDDERKPRTHIHLGGIIILIIIILILFEVDIKSKIESPELKKNITFIETEVKDFWQKYIVSPTKTKAGEVFIDATNKGLSEIQDNFTKNVLKEDSTTDTNN
jgi:hypothetical protein